MAQNYIFPPGFSSVSIPAVGTNGALAPSSSILIGGKNPSNNLQPVSVDSSGNVNVNITSVATNPLPTSDAADGPVTPGTVATKSILIGGQYNTSLPTLSTGQQSAIQMDSSGRALLSPLTNSSVVKAQLQDNAGNAITSTASALDVNLKTSATTLNDNIAQFGGINVSLGQKVSASSMPVVIASDQSAVPASQSGTWNITNISGTVSLPTGASTSANQTTANTSLSTIATNTTGLNSTIAATGAAVPADALQIGVKNGSNLVPITQGSATSANSIPVVIASDQSALPSQAGRSSANAPVQNLYGSINITTAAYVQLVASTTSTTNYLDIFDSSGQAMILATGGSGSEVIQAYVPPGGDQIPLKILSGTRVAYKALSANATSGYLLMNFYT